LSPLKTICIRVRRGSIISPCDRWTEEDCLVTQILATFYFKISPSLIQRQKQMGNSFRLLASDPESLSLLSSISRSDVAIQPVSHGQGSSLPFSASVNQSVHSSIRALLINILRPVSGFLLDVLSNCVRQHMSISCFHFGLSLRGLIARTRPRATRDRGAAAGQYLRVARMSILISPSITMRLMGHI
jgi:hypothetical protein